MGNCRLILASASPRRKELLSFLGVDFEVRKSEGEEITTKTVPSEIVCELSKQKAEEVAENVLKEDGGSEGVLLVIGADTIVASKKTADAEILGKPASEKEACSMIASFQGKSHYVYTGVTVLIYQKKGKDLEKEEISFAEETEVFVCEMTEEEIRDYVSKGESLDKAGAYGIQGSFAPFIRKIHGDYYNVVGLPVSRLYGCIKKYLK